jgi:methylated-DNA-[protein]-cysteine S-methyltransferase
MKSYTTIPSPLGELLLTGGDAGLAGVSLPGQKSAPDIQAGWRRDETAFKEAERQLAAYFAGERTRFELETAPEGTAFQREVWDALDGIPYGTTTTYGRLAEQLGVARGDIRALGAAVGANPLLIVRPCHRVIGADGSMRGYAAGVERKQALLTLEGALQPMLGS